MDGCPDTQTTLTEQNFSPEAKNKQLMTNRTLRNIKAVKHNKKRQAKRQPSTNATVSFVPEKNKLTSRHLTACRKNFLFINARPL